MSKTPVPFASETLETIQRAFRHASRRRHDTVGLEHLLLSITEEPTARQQLAACGADLPSLRAERHRRPRARLRAGARVRVGGAGAHRRASTASCSRR